MLELRRETPQEVLAALADQADREREAWRVAGLLAGALADDPELPAVVTVFQLGPRAGFGLHPNTDDNVARARLALGRAIRKVMADGGPEITHPSRVLSLFTLGHEPRYGEIPRFKDGEPVEEPGLGMAAG